MTKYERTNQNSVGDEKNVSLTPAVTVRKRDLRGAFVGAACMLVGIGSGFGMGVFGGSQNARSPHPVSVQRATISHGMQSPISDKAFLGVRYLPKQSAAQNAKHPHGRIVEAVVPHSAAALAGLQKGDVILTIGGKPVEAGSRLSALVLSHLPGQKTKVLLKRGEKNIVKEVILGRTKKQRRCNK